MAPWKVGWGDDDLTVGLQDYCDSCGGATIRAQGGQGGMCFEGLDQIIKPQINRGTGDKKECWSELGEGVTPGSGYGGKGFFLWKNGAREGGTTWGEYSRTGLSWERGHTLELRYDRIGGKEGGGAQIGGGVN